MPKAAELMAARLRREIVRGDLPEGEALLPEGQLIEKLGVSRLTLREASRILESESLITRATVPGCTGRAAGSPRSSFAHLLQARKVTVGDVHRVRTILEPAVVRLVAEKPTKRLTTRLRVSLRAEFEAIDDPAAHSMASNDFH